MNLMKKIPGGTLLFPMFISALITTFIPDLFKIGGLTESIFSGVSMNFLLASAVFLSGTLLNLSVLDDVIKRYGFLIITRLASNVIFGVLFAKSFGLAGIFGISTIAFITALTSLNPTIFLAIINDYGDEIDKAAFGLLSLVASPLVPMFIYGLTSPTELNIMPIVSTLIPLVVGVIIGNLDKELATFLGSGMNYIIFFLGWTVGASINLLDALRAGFAGLIMVVIYYIFTFAPVYLVERIFFKRKGLSAIAMSTLAGLSASIPMMMATNNPELLAFAPSAAAIISLCVVISAVISPAIAKRLHDGNAKNE